MTDVARLPTHNGHSLLAGLRRARRQPVMILGETTLTGGDVLDAAARYITVLRRHGIDSGAPVGVLALNRPEVLFTIAAGQLRGHRRTALHPLGGVDDHAYILTDAGITTLILYDRYPGGLGYAEKAFDKIADVLSIAREMVAECPCDEGCPSCVGLPNLRPAIHSDPDLARGYPMPDKAATIELLALLCRSGTPCLT